MRGVDLLRDGLSYRFAVTNRAETTLNSRIIVTRFVAIGCWRHDSSQGKQRSQAELARPEGRIEPGRNAGPFVIKPYPCITNAR